MSSTSSGASMQSTTVNGRQVVSGLSSGFDTDSIVKKTIQADSWKLYKMQQKEQLAEWRQTKYRELISGIKEFSDKYFELSSDSSLLSTKNLSKYSTTSSNSAAVSVIAGSAATAGSHTLAVSQLATAASRTTGDAAFKGVMGASEANFTAAKDKSFVINVDGTERTITINSSITTAADLQDAVNTAVGSGKVTVSDSTGKLTFAAVANSGVQKITLSAPPTDSGLTSALSDLGFGSGAVLSNRLKTSDTLETIAKQTNTELTFNNDGQLALTINGVNFTFDKSETLGDVMSEVNKSSAGATLKYDETSGKLTLAAKQTGAGNTLVVSESGGNFLAAVLNGTPTEGKDAKFTLDNVAMTRGSNTVTVDNLTYTLKDTTVTKDTEGNITATNPVTVGVNLDTDGIYKAISSFVDDYNTMIDAINTTISETYDRNYPPLYDDQKTDMTDEEITKWEKKAKTGILEHDSTLDNFVSEMRSALSSFVTGSSINLSSIGITTSAYTEKGKLHISESKLKAAIASDPDAIVQLFTQQSKSYSGLSTVRTLTTEQAAIRYKEEGLSYRIYDTLQKYTSTLRDTGGNKGLMLVKAGIKDDGSDTENAYSKEIKDYKKRIKDEKTRLDNEEDALYKKYSAMETALSNLSSQYSVLSSFTAG